MSLNFSICYALISHPGSLYAEQCIISIYSLRRIHPEAYILIYTDQETADTFEGSRKVISELADKIVIKKFEPHVNNKVRSRILKTTLPEVAYGNLLFVDTDTLFRGSLYNLNAFLKESAPLHAVRDGHRNLTDMASDVATFHRNNADMLGYDINEENRHFFNSGVMLIKECEESRVFYRKWNENYLQGLKDFGIATDQATLCLTNREMGHPIAAMGKDYNFQISAARYGLQHCRILHYFASVKALDKPLFPLQDNGLLQQLAVSGTIPAIVDKCITDPASQIDYIGLTYRMIRRTEKLSHLLNKFLQVLFVARSAIFKL